MMRIYEGEYSGDLAKILETGKYIMEAVLSQKIAENLGKRI
jgi:hypothetical protein